MRKGLLAIIFLVMLCFAVFQPKMEEVYATSNNQFIITGYGDSISYGETLTDLTKAYPAVFAQNYVQDYGAEFVSKGVSGDTTSDLLQDLQPYIDGTAVDMQSFEDIDIVTLCIGANNILGPAFNNISGFLTGSVTETQYQAILDEGVSQFKEDYPQILSAFEGKKVVVMTIFNPYKYVSLNDISIDPSIASFESMIRSALTTYETKFQTMLNMSMNSLQIINDEIRNSANESVSVVDIWNLFDGFSKDEYLQYINADISQLTLNMSHVNSIMKGDLTTLMSEITSTCDPHPTEAGHSVIAVKHIENFKLFDLSVDKTFEDLNKTDKITFRVNPIDVGSFTYKFFKQTDAGSELIAETNNNSIEVEAQDLEGSGKVYVEIYSPSKKLETTNEISFDIHFEEDPTPPENSENPENPSTQEETKKTKEKDNIIVISVLSVMFGLPTITLLIYFIIKQKNKIKFL